MNESQIIKKKHISKAENSGGEGVVDSNPQPPVADRVKASPVMEWTYSSIPLVSFPRPPPPLNASAKSAIELDPPNMLM